MLNTSPTLALLRRIPKKIRRFVQLSLAVFVVLAGSLAWSWNYWIHNQTDGLTRYIRVDSWSVYQSLLLFSDLNTVLARYGSTQLDQSRSRGSATNDDRFLADQDVGGRSPAPRQIGVGIARARASLDLLRQQDQDPLLLGEHYPSVDEQGALMALEQRLLSQDPAPDRGLVARAGAEIGRISSVLRRQARDLSTVRFELQDQDLQKARSLIASNQLVLLIFYGSVGALGLMLLLEALVARHSEQRASASERRFRDISEVASDSIWETGPDGELIFASDRGLHAEQFSLTSRLGQSLASLAGQDMRQSGVRAMNDAMAAGQEFRDVVVNAGTENDHSSQRIIKLSGKPVLDGKGWVNGYRGVASDITDEVRQEEKIRYLAENDSLTKLPNRHKFQENLKNLRLAIDRDREIIAIILIDLNGFKEINDTVGHQIGDLLLIRVAERINHQLTDNALLGRLGGDEFAILIRDSQQHDQRLQATGERIVWALSRPFDINGKTLAIGASAGIASFPGEPDEDHELLQAADLALFAAKQQGNGCVIRYRADMALEMRNRHALERELRAAIDQGGLELNFQPQVDLASGALIGAEALVRWEHPTLGRVNPELFVSIAEERGMIRALGRWVLTTACEEAMRWPSGIVAVNVSPNQFLHDDLVELVRAVLADTGLPACRLELEITEGVLMQREDDAIAVLEALRAMGIQLAIDDFGTGYSSLSYLKRFPVHKVKIDRSFVMDLDRDHDDQMIVKAILSLGQALGLKTIAEGIEVNEHVKILERLGCDEGQGYFFGRPMSVDDFCDIAVGSMAIAPKQPANRSGSDKRSYQMSTIAKPVNHGQDRRVAV